MNPIITLIRHDFSARVQKNRRYSLRAYARFLEIEPSALSKLMRGKRTVSESMSRRLSIRLGLATDAPSSPTDGLHSNSRIPSPDALRSEIRLLSGELIRQLERDKRPHVLRVSFYPLEDK